MKNIKYFGIFFIIIFALAFASASIYVMPQKSHTEDYYQYVSDSDYFKSGSSSSDYSSSQSNSFSLDDSSRYSSLRYYRRSPSYSSYQDSESGKSSSSSSSKSSSSFSESESSHLMITEYHYTNNEKYPAIKLDYRNYPRDYRDHGYVDYRYDYSPTHSRDYYGSPDYYYTYYPYLRSYKKERCNHYPPQDKLFYVKCP